LEYDGSRYSGWAEQTNARTVMGALRRAAETVFGCPVELGGAGRTDGGVHASGQVAHLRADLRGVAPPLERLLLQLNEELPYDIAVREIVTASPRFHARHDAISRVYSYRIARQKDAFSKKFVWWIKSPINVEKMSEAAALLAGKHDFVLFRASDPARPDESTIVHVESASIEVRDRIVEFHIEASHFLWRMVRRLAGALAKVGLGELTLENFRRLLNAEPVRGVDLAAWTAPSSGLFLEKVNYPAGATSGAAQQPRAAASRSTPRDRAPRR
jgi:tRNA pseudouridine38-40 synthase